LCWQNLVSQRIRDGISGGLSLKFSQHLQQRGEGAGHAIKLPFGRTREERLKKTIYGEIHFNRLLILPIPQYSPLTILIWNSDRMPE